MWSRGSSARYIQGLALSKLGRDAEAETIFRTLQESPRHALANPARIDPTAPAATQQIQRTRAAQAHFAAGLGSAGLGRRDEARRELEQCLKISPDHLGARVQLLELKGEP